MSSNQEISVIDTQEDSSQDLDRSSYPFEPQFNKETYKTGFQLYNEDITEARNITVAQ